MVRRVMLAGATLALVATAGLAQTAPQAKDTTPTPKPAVQQRLSEQEQQRLGEIRKQMQTLREEARQILRKAFPGRAGQGVARRDGAGRERWRERAGAGRRFGPGMGQGFRGQGPMGYGMRGRQGPGNGMGYGPRGGQGFGPGMGYRFHGRQSGPGMGFRFYGRQGGQCPYCGQACPAQAVPKAK